MELLQTLLDHESKLEKLPTDIILYTFLNLKELGIMNHIVLYKIKIDDIQWKLRILRYFEDDTWNTHQFLDTFKPQNLT